MKRTLATSLAMALVFALPTANGAEQWITNAQLIDGLPGSKVRTVNLRIADGRIAEITAAGD